MSFLSSVFGGGDSRVTAPAVNFTPPDFNGGGLNGSFGINTYNVTPDANRTATVGGLSDTFSTLGNKYGDLLKTVSPGYNDLLRARLTSFNNDASSAIGTLSQNLQSRRVLGSSFGQDTLTRANNQFAQQRDAIVADNFLKSLEASNQLLTQQYGAYSQAFNTKLNELNLEANLASQMSSKTVDILNQNARTEAQLSEQASAANAKNATDQASGFGSFLGKLVGGGGLGGGGITIPTAVADLGFIGL